MSLKEVGSQTESDFLARASRVALDTSVGDAFFQSMGEIASEAILREDINALDMIYGGLDMKSRNLQDRDMKMRLLGSSVIVAGGRLMVRRLQQNGADWPDRATNRAALAQAIDKVLVGTQTVLIPIIGRVIPDAIQSFNKEYLAFGCEQLGRLTDPKIPGDLRMLVTGMLDVVRPAFARVKGK